MDARYLVVVNKEEQYSIWPEMKPLPKGWKEEGFKGVKDECLHYINEVWVDMRPLSLRKKLKERSSLENIEIPELPSDDLVERLCSKKQLIHLDPQMIVFEDLMGYVDQKFIYIHFPNTKGGTSIGMHIDSFNVKTDTEGVERAHIEGSFNLNFTNLKCLVEIDLSNMEGRAELKKLKEQE